MVIRVRSIEGIDTQIVPSHASLALLFVLKGLLISQQTTTYPGSKTKDDKCTAKYLYKYRGSRVSKDDAYA